MAILAPGTSNANVAINVGATQHDIGSGGIFTLGGWIKVNSVPGSFCYLIGMAGYRANNSFNVFRNGTSNAAAWAIHDGSGGRLNSTGTEPLIASDLYASANFGVWRHFMIRGDGTNVETFMDGVQTYTDPINGSWAGLTAGTDRRLAQRGDGGGTEGDTTYADWAQWSVALTDDQIAALAGGAAAAFFPVSRQWYAELIREAVEVDSNLSVTFTGTSVEDHPPLHYPARVQVGVPTAATGFNAALTAPTFGMAAQDLALSAAYEAELSAATFGMSGQDIGIAAAYAAELSAATFGMSGQPITLSAAFVAELSAASFSMSAQAIDIASGDPVSLSAPTFAMSAQSIDLSAAFVAELSAGSFSMSASPITIPGDEPAPSANLTRNLTDGGVASPLTEGGV